MDEARKQQYFAELAPQYSTLTGNTTQDIFAKFLASHEIGITASSIIHDNAAGPGTATQILVERYSESSPTIVATDYASGMITALEQIQASKISSNPAWGRVRGIPANSSDLSMFQDEYFTHSVSNFSLFTITDAVQSLRETYRTLTPGGTAVVLLWKRYPIQHLLSAAQDLVKGKGYAKENAVPVNGPQYFEEGIVERQMIEAGFEPGKIETVVMEHLVVDEEGEKWKWDGLFEYLTGSSIAAGSTRGWTDEEVKTWPDAVRGAMAKEKEKYRGVFCEAWVTIIRK